MAQKRFMSESMKNCPNPQECCFSVKTGHSKKTDTRFFFFRLAFANNTNGFVHHRHAQLCCAKMVKWYCKRVKSGIKTLALFQFLGHQVQ